MAAADAYAGGGGDPIIRPMSLHQIFDYLWNFPIPWLWIFGAIGAIWLLVIVVGLVVASDIRKEGRNDRKPSQTP